MAESDQKDYNIIVTNDFLKIAQSVPVTSSKTNVRTGINTKNIIKQQLLFSIVRKIKDDIIDHVTYKCPMNAVMFL